jgi:hypothetical protein
MCPIHCVFSRSCTAVLDRTVAIVSVFTMQGAACSPIAWRLPQPMAALPYLLPVLAKDSPAATALSAMVALH